MLQPTNHIAVAEKELTEDAARVPARALPEKHRSLVCGSLIVNADDWGSFPGRRSGYP